jgi:uncharacterized membrane protein
MADELNSTPAGTGLTDNVAGAIAYITIIPAIIFLIVEPYNKNSFVRFNSWQSVFLFLAIFVLDIVFEILIGVVTLMSPYTLLGYYLWRLLSLFWLCVIAYCAYNAYQGKRYKLPFIGAIAERQAGA